MAPKRGKLKPADEAKIQSNYPELLDDIEPKELTPHLFKHNVINRDDKEEIECHKTRKERAKVFLDKISNAGPGDAYRIFVDLLKEAGYDHLVDSLESTDTSKMEADSQPCVLDLPDEVLDKPVSDASASRLTGFIGDGWEDLFLQLGLTKIVVQKEKGQVQGDVVITNLIIRWRQKEGKNGKWRKFFDVLVDLVNKGRITADMENVKRIAAEQS